MTLAWKAALDARNAELLIKLALETAPDIPMRPGLPPREPSPISERLRTDWRRIVVEHLLERDGDRCYLCRQELNVDPHVDHIVPVSLGGTDTMTNLALAHESCNITKGPSIVAIRVSDRTPWYPPAKSGRGKPSRTPLR